MKYATPLPSFLTFISLLIVVCSSCKKNDSANSTTKSSSLTGVTWTSQKVEFQQSDNTWKTQDDADFHFSFTFNTDNTFSVTQTFSGGTKTKTGTWHLINNDTQLTLAGNEYQGTYTITEQSSTTLQWTVVSLGFWGTSGAVRETFGH